MTVTNRIRRLLALTSLAFVLVVTGACAAEMAAHKHEAGDSPTQLKLNDGRKWATDSSLRKGMENIRVLMTAALPAIHTNKLSNSKYNALAQKVSNDVAYIVANCKLDPQADEQLHLIIADILSGVEMMQGKTKNAKRQTGAVQILGALEKYDIYFDHPGTKPIQH